MCWHILVSQPEGRVETLCASFVHWIHACVEVGWRVTTTSLLQGLACRRNHCASGKSAHGRFPTLLMLGVHQHRTPGLRLGRQVDSTSFQRGWPAGGIIVRVAGPLTKDSSPFFNSLCFNDVDTNFFSSSSCPQDGARGGSMQVFYITSVYVSRTTWLNPSKGVDSGMFRCSVMSVFTSIQYCSSLCPSTVCAKSHVDYPLRG